MNLPDDYRPYADKYFLRTKEILEKKELNPYVKAQVFIRKGPGKVAGLQEAVALIKKFLPAKSDAQFWTLNDGDEYQAGDVVLAIIARAQDIVALETLYLGVISMHTTLANENGISEVQVGARAQQIVKLAEGRPVYYFGARHWHWEYDKSIAKCLHECGIQEFSTDAGASVAEKAGIGTIPHFLEAVLHWSHGLDCAVVEALRAFDEVMEPGIPRIALVDYANREITDTVACMEALGERLDGIRIDTCGENFMQNCRPSESHKKDPVLQYIFGPGVCVHGVKLVIEAMREKVGPDGKMPMVILSSGFADPEKVRIFTEAEKILDMKLFDALGCGQFYESRSATMDIVQVGDKPSNMKPIGKVGRKIKENKNLKKVL
jgi:nicotinate phosphoribosyltransferase